MLCAVFSANKRWPSTAPVTSPSDLTSLTTTANETTLREADVHCFSVGN